MRLPYSSPLPLRERDRVRGTVMARQHPPLSFANDFRFAKSGSAILPRKGGEGRASEVAV